MTFGSLSLSVFLLPESTDEEMDKLHCLNHSGSSATYSDYSPSQGSSGSSNPPTNTHSHTHSHALPHPHPPAMPTPSKDQAPQTHWTNRSTHTHTVPSLFLHLFIHHFPLLINLPTVSSIHHRSSLSIHPSSASHNSSFFRSFHQGQSASLGFCRFPSSFSCLFSLVIHIFQFRKINCKTCRETDWSICFDYFEG